MRGNQECITTIWCLYTKDKQAGEQKERGGSGHRVKYPWGEGHNSGGGNNGNGATVILCGRGQQTVKGVVHRRRGRGCGRRDSEVADAEYRAARGYSVPRLMDQSDRGMI